MRASFALAPFLAACGTLRVDVHAQEPKPPVPDSRPGVGGNRGPVVPDPAQQEQFEAQFDWVPRMVMEFDEEEGPLLAAGLGDASGEGVALTGGLGGPGSIAGLQVSRVELDASGASVLLQTIGVTAGYRVPLDANGVVSTEFAGGLGLATIDVDLPGLDTNASAYVGSHLGLRLEPVEALSFTASVGANVFFDPGDSEGSATFVALGVSIRF